MNARIVISACVALASAPCLSQVEEVVSPLVGTWVLCVDPDGGAKDSMEFFPEGYGFNLRSGKPKVPFLFKEAGSQVMLAVNARGNLVTIYLSVDKSYSRLTNKNERNGNEAIYVRREKVAESGCTAK
jgi:hypothetical protein